MIKPDIVRRFTTTSNNPNLYSVLIAFNIGNAFNKAEYTLQHTVSQGYGIASNERTRYSQPHQHKANSSSSPSPFHILNFKLRTRAREHRNPSSSPTSSFPFNDTLYRTNHIRFLRTPSSRPQHKTPL